SLRNDTPRGPLTQARQNFREFFRVILELRPSTAKNARSLPNLLPNSSEPKYLNHCRIIPSSSLLLDFGNLAVGCVSDAPVRKVSTSRVPRRHSQNTAESRVKSSIL